MDDYLHRGTISKENIRFTITNSKELLTKLIFQQKTDPISSYFLSSAFNASLLTIPLLNKNEKNSFQWRYNNSIKLLTIDTYFDSKIRAFISNTQLAQKHSSTNNVLKKNGIFQAIKFKNEKIIHQGFSKAPLLNCAKDLAFYYSTNEQTETEISSFIQFQNKEQSPINFSFALLVQAMPEVNIKKFEKLRNFIHTNQCKKIIQTSIQNPEKIIKKILTQTKINSPFEISSHSKPELYCNCSKEKMKNYISSSLSKEEVQSIIKEKGKLTISCHFCNMKYNFHNF